MPSPDRAEAIKFFADMTGGCQENICTSITQRDNMSRRASEAFAKLGVSSSELMDLGYEEYA